MNDRRKFLIVRTRDAAAGIGHCAAAQVREAGQTRIIAGPTEQATDFELVVDMKTPEALGLVCADKVID